MLTKYFASMSHTPISKELSLDKSILEDPCGFFETNIPIIKIYCGMPATESRKRSISQPWGELTGIIRSN